MTKDKILKILDDIETRNLILRGIEDKARANKCKPELTIDDIITICLDTVKAQL